MLFYFRTEQASLKSHVQRKRTLENRPWKLLSFTYAHLVFGTEDTISIVTFPSRHTLRKNRWVWALWPTASFKRDSSKDTWVKKNSSRHFSPRSSFSFQTTINEQNPLLFYLGSWGGYPAQDPQSHFQPWLYIRPIQAGFYCCCPGNWTQGLVHAK